MILTLAPFFIGVCSRDEIVGQIYYKTGLGLTQVPTDIPPDIGQVHLDSNSITNLLKDSFVTLAQCTVLKMRHNSIRSIEGGTFNGLDKLDTVDLYQNNVKVLEKSMFDGLPLLRFLNIAGNGVTTIPSGCFGNLSNLEELHLTSHGMTTITGDMWLGLNSLTNLDLQISPRMRTIPPGGLSNLPKLDTLHLHRNALRTLTKDMFNATDYPDSDGHPPVLELSLSGNPLVCDKHLCWVKQAENEGWLFWERYQGVTYSPDCTNNVDWNDVALNCSAAGNQKSINYSTRKNTVPCKRSLVHVVIQHHTL